MLAKLSDGWRNGLSVTFVLVVSLAVGVLVWFIMSRGGDSPLEPVAVANDPSSVPLAIDEAGEAGIPLDLDFGSEPAGAVAVEADSAWTSKGGEEPQPEFSWSGWQLQSIDGVEIAGAADKSIRCRAMSTDRTPDPQVVGQLVYLIEAVGGTSRADFHISQINNYYRCDLDLEWSAIVVGYQPDICFDLTHLGGAVSLTAGRGDKATSHLALPPWIGAECSADPNPTGRISIEVNQKPGQPDLAEITYEGTFRVFVPKNDYAQVIRQILVEVEPGVEQILQPVKVERL